VRRPGRCRSGSSPWTPRGCRANAADSANRTYEQLAITAAASELEQAGITEPLGIVLADAGYWNGPHIDALVARGMRVLVRPDADTRKAPSRLRQGGLYDFVRAVLGRPDGQALYRQRQAIIEPVIAHTKICRRADRFQRRGLAACRAEWRLLAATHNLLG
jgi:hypothetical protein